MKPILFDKTATSFNSNGLGTLNFISCEVTEERNGQFELEAEITEEELHAAEIDNDSIIVSKYADGSSKQPFRVYNIRKKSNGRFEILAQHISYDMNKITTMPISITGSDQACALSLAGIKSNAIGSCPFNFSTDVHTVASFGYTTPMQVRSLLGGVRGSILDQFGGEYEWDNYNVKLWANRGVTVPTVSLRYGKNIKDLDQEKNISDVITGVVPFWTDSEGKNLMTLTEKVVTSQYASSYPIQRTVTLDLSDQYEEKPTETQMRTTAQAYVNQAGLGIPKVSIKVSFVQLWQTEEYADIAPLERVKLCDRVKVEFEKLGISTTAKVVKTVYDVLNDRYSSIEIGSVRTSLADTISDTSGLLETTLQQATYAAKNATYWLTSSHGYVMAVKNPDGTWKELLFLDTNDAETAHNVLRINNNGIGFSRNGVNGTYTNAWTIDGHLVADFVDTGTLKGVTIQAGGQNNANGTIIVKDSNGNTVVTLNVDGIAVSKGSISGSTIVVGGNNNTSGTITVKDASNNNAVVLNSSGITVNKGSITGSTITAGGSNNASGTITVNDSNNTVIVQMTNSGLVVKKGTIEGASIKIGGQNNQSGTITMLDSSGNTMGYWNNAELNVGNGATKLGSQNIQTKWLDCATANGEAWFPNGMYINRGGNGKFEGRSYAVNTSNNQNGGMIEAYQDGIITITRDLYVAGTIRNSSDIRLKTNVKPLKNSIELIKKMHPISFKTIDDTEHTRHGLIAQDFEELSNYGEWIVWCETDDGYQELAYMELIADIIEVEQEILKRLEDIEEKLKKGDD